MYINLVCPPPLFPPFSPLCPLFSRQNAIYLSPNQMGDGQNCLQAPYHDAPPSFINTGVKHLVFNIIIAVVVLEIVSYTFFGVHNRKDCNHRASSCFEYRPSYELYRTIHLHAIDIKQSSIDKHQHLRVAYMIWFAPL